MSAKFCAFFVVVLSAAVVTAAARPLTGPEAQAVLAGVEGGCVEDCVDMCNSGDLGSVLPGPGPAKLTIVCYLDGPVRSCTIV